MSNANSMSECGHVMACEAHIKVGANSIPMQHKECIMNYVSKTIMTKSITTWNAVVNCLLLKDIR